VADAFIAEQAAQAADATAHGAQIKRRGMNTSQSWGGGSRQRRKQPGFTYTIGSVALQTSSILHAETLDDTISTKTSRHSMQVSCFLSIFYSWNGVANACCGVQACKARKVIGAHQCA
jgi:hypothetical protein